MPIDVTAAEFCERFGQFQQGVQREPMEVHSHGQVTGYFVSPETFEPMERLTSASRRAYHPAELPGHLKAALREASMEAGHEHLDALLHDG